MKYLIVILSFSISQLGFSKEIENIPSYSGSISTMILGLLSVITILYGLVWLSKKIGINNYGNKDLKIISTLSLTNKEKVIVIQYDNKKILLGVAPGSVSCIDVDEIFQNNNDLDNKKEGHFSDKLMKIINSNSTKVS